jgi:hypothetical protein
LTSPTEPFWALKAFGGFRERQASDLREMLGDEYEQWRDHVKTTEEGRRLIITRHLLQRLVQNPNTIKLNEKT